MFWKYSEYPHSVILKVYHIFYVFLCIIRRVFNNNIFCPILYFFALFLQKYYIIWHFFGKQKKYKNKCLRDDTDNFIKRLEFHLNLYSIQILIIFEQLSVFLNVNNLYVGRRNLYINWQYFVFLFRSEMLQSKIISFSYQKFKSIVDTTTTGIYLYSI